MAVSHIYNQTVADGTATSVVRPSDWNSAHNQWQTIVGNTVGVSTFSGTNLVFAGGNNLTLSLNGSTLSFSGANTGAEMFGISNLGNTSGTSGTITGIAITQLLAGGNNITLSQSTAAGAATVTISAGGGTLSRWDNILAPLAGTQTLVAFGSSHYVFPFVVPQYISASYIRFPVSWGLTSTSFATSAVPTSTTFSHAGTANAVIFSQNTGASSRSLAFHASGSVGWTWQVSATIANATNNWTISQNITYPFEGTTIGTLASSWASTLSTVNVSTTGLTNFTGWRYLDIPFATLLTPGNYWMAINENTTTGGGKALNMNMSFIVHSQTNQAIGNLNAATNSSLALWVGLGSWSTNAIGTTSSIGLGSLSSVASHLLPTFQLIRQA